MEIAKRSINDIINEQLVEEINNEINKHILNKMFEICHTLGDNKNYDKFKIIASGNNIIPYNVKEFIQRQIDKEVEQGYIECKIKNINKNIITYHIDLDDLYSITYIYDKNFEPNYVIRMHQTNEEHQKNEDMLLSPTLCGPRYFPYKTDLKDIPTVGNYNSFNKSKYYIYNDHT
jgi:hypothetical protein